MSNWTTQDISQRKSILVDVVSQIGAGTILALVVGLHVRRQAGISCLLGCKLQKLWSNGQLRRRSSATRGPAPQLLQGAAVGEPIHALMGPTLSKKNQQDYKHAP